MDPLYESCRCKSGDKFKFCCFNAIQTNNTEHLKKTISSFPVLCFARPDLDNSQGMTIAIVGREMAPDYYIAGYYLLDLYCLGVKDADIRRNLTQREFRDFLMVHTQAHPMVQYEYEHMRSMILGSVAYAAALDIHPPQDWQSAKFLVEPERSFENTVTFGQNGRPFYVEGPYDQKIRDTIIRKVIAAGGNSVAHL